ncbi:SDH family Clp fold serine proteinase [Teredinibacter turnerae]|uniref:SDH family Clp fold serine proteinase n=1 Tax=Teredinibacter turnerae TaxID=2426 RepID=UPI0030D2C560
MNEDENKKTEEEPEKEERVYDLSKTTDLVSAFRDGLSEEKIKSLISNHIEKLISTSGVNKDYEVVFLFDEDRSISSYHSNKIYEAVKDIDKKNILMILQSGGGQIEPAYLISKACKRLCKAKFNVTIPRKAKSAATLIALGASEIHMGLLSELGPIDPQFGGFPALGLSNAMEKIAAMSERYPKASDMFAKYLTENVNIRHLGLFERVNESAAQYAERLLMGKELPDGKTPDILADHFTNHYKDHGFVIDSDEASSLLGRKMIKEGSKEYELGNTIYDFLSFVQFLYSFILKKDMRYVGSVKSGLDLNEKESD